jgi:hypothetical protein
MGGRGTLYRPVTLESAATAGLVGAQKDVDMLYLYSYGRACQRRPILRQHRAEPWVRVCDVSVLYSQCNDFAAPVGKNLQRLYGVDF